MTGDKLIFFFPMITIRPDVRFIYRMIGKILQKLTKTLIYCIKAKEFSSSKTLLSTKRN